ncbi:MAG: universal stress protein [Undibacterium sp.]|nr:universal stress protein [Undibacterium sp.]
MFNHILMPTDGSETSKKIIQDCLALAKSTGARVTGIHVIPEFHIFTYQTEMLEDTREQFSRDSITQAKKYLEEIENAAKEAHVKCDTVYVVDDNPYEAIIKTAEREKCDLIAMASHGRKGLKGLLLGSEAQKVLTHSQIPVLIFH